MQRLRNAVCRLPCCGPPNPACGRGVAVGVFMDEIERPGRKLACNPDRTIIKHNLGQSGFLEGAKDGEEPPLVRAAVLLLFALGSAPISVVVLALH